MKWAVGLLVIAVVVLMGLLCNKPKLPTDLPILTGRNDSLKAVIKTHDSTDLIRYTMVKLHDSVVTRQRDSLADIINAKTVALKTAKNDLYTLSQRVEVLVNQQHDTALSLAYDSLQQHLDSAYILVASLNHAQNESIKVLGSELEYKDSLIRIQNTEIKDLKGALTSCTLNFDGLNKDTQQLRSQVKKQSLFTKIAAGIGVVVGILIKSI